MKTLGNIIWFFTTGLISWFIWFIATVVCFISIVGIPIGVQCLKLGHLSLVPFGKEIVYNGGLFSSFLNILWFLTFGLALAFVYVSTGIVWCISIIGIPFGLQAFKLARLALFPFGSTIENQTY